MKRTFVKQLVLIWIGWVSLLACTRQYENGTYCAKINYYYPRTGTRSTYMLKVEVKDNKLIKIYWPNGGWLDDSHFYPPDISDGHAEFVSDIGAKYTVDIVAEEGNCYFFDNAR